MVSKRSAHEITKTFFEGVLKNSSRGFFQVAFNQQIEFCGRAPRPLIGGTRTARSGSRTIEPRLRPFSNPISKKFMTSCLSRSRSFSITDTAYAIHSSPAKRGTRHWSWTSVAGPSDVSVVDTTASGDVSGSGRNSRPLAAASIAVGGAYINMSIAKDLLVGRISTRASIGTESPGPGRSIVRVPIRICAQTFCTLSGT